MKPPAFKYTRARSCDEAVALLQEHGDDAKLLAGGQSLVPLMNFRLAQPAVLVDLNHANDLDFIRRDNGHLVIGAITRQRTVETSALVHQTVPLLSEAMSHVGHVTIRNRGTIGGSAAHADPAAELPVALLALDAEVGVQGPSGNRSIKANEFFTGSFSTLLELNEVLTEVRIPVPRSGTGAAIAESARRHGDFGIVVVMAVVRLAADGRCDDARVSVGGVEAVPTRRAEAESALIGVSPSAEAIDAAAEAAAGAMSPVDDIHAPAEYRRHLTHVFVRRALSEAVNRVKDGTA